MAYEVANGAVIDRPDRMSWAAWTTAPWVVPAAPVDRVAATPLVSRPIHPVLPRCPEIDCVRHLLPPGILAFAELQAAEVGVGADRVLIAQGLIDEETYLAELARELGCEFEPLDDKPRAACPLTDDRMIEAVYAGMLPLIGADGVKIVIAPREFTVRRMVKAQSQNSDLASRIRVTSGARLARYAALHAKQTIGYTAAEALRAEQPELSAGTGQRRSVITAILVAGIAMFALVASGDTALAIEVTLGVVFLAWTMLRLLGTFSLRSVRRTPKFIPDHQLPVYTVVIALYHEAAAVSGLIASLRKLHYPALGSKCTKRLTFGSVSV